MGEEKVKKSKVHKEGKDKSHKVHKEGKDKSHKVSKEGKDKSHKLPKEGKDKSHKVPKEGKEKSSKEGKEKSSKGTKGDARAFPLATAELERAILTLVGEGKKLGALRRGANESTKTLNRGTAELVVLAADAVPLEILLHLPLLCEDKNVPYVFVSSAAVLGRACGVSRPVISASVMARENNPLQTTINGISQKIDQLCI